MKSIKTKLRMLQAVLDLYWIYIVRKKVGNSCKILFMAGQLSNDSQSRDKCSK